jgi:hypothetical protein
LLSFVFSDFSDFSGFIGSVGYRWRLEERGNLWELEQLTDSG